MKPPIPVLRVFDEHLAKAFYAGFLGFTVDWEHRFEPGLPLYMQVHRGNCVLHLSEHYGDATPGSAVRIETPDLDAYVRGLRESGFRNCRPGDPELQPWGLREITLTDPFGNRLTLYSQAAS